MAQPIPRRLLERGRNRTVQETSRESYPSTAEHVEGREGYVPSPVDSSSDAFHLCFCGSEYQLVAGGEELFQENGLLAGPPRTAPSDVRVKEEYRDMQSPFTPRTPSDSSDIQSENESAGHDAHHALGAPTERIPAAFLGSVPLAHSVQPGSAVKDEGFDLQLPFPVTIPPISSLMTTSVAPPPSQVRNSITAVSLTAAGMRPLVIEVERYAPPSPTLANFAPRVAIHIKLSLSSLHDVSSPPALHGFSGTVSFAAPWTNVAQCMTRVFAGGVCESVDYAYFEPAASLSPLSIAPVTVPLPESELSRCRWGNIGEDSPWALGLYWMRLEADTWPSTGVETRIDQVVTVDNEELAWITYDLTWTASGPPSAEILSVQRDSQEQQEREQQQQQQFVVAAPTPLPEPASFLSLNSWNSETSYVPYASYVPRSQEPSLAYSPYSPLGGSSNGDQHYTHYSSVLFS